MLGRLPSALTSLDLPSATPPPTPGVTDQTGQDLAEAGGRRLVPSSSSDLISLSLRDTESAEQEF